MKGALPALMLPASREAALLFPARLAGHQARVALERGASWRMLALFARGFYCQNQMGDLIFLGSLSLAPGPLNVLCDLPVPWDWQQEGLHGATTVRLEGRTLWVDGRFGFPFGNARPWTRAEGPGRWDQAAMAGRMPWLFREAAGRNLAEGFGPLIPCFTEMAEGPCGAPTPLILAAWPGIEALYQGLQGWLAGSVHPLSRADEEAVAGLIGLGPGLTPSGDDLLGGAMIALHALGRKEIAAQLARIVLPRARVRTGTVSRAHLACAAGGEGSEALHDAISALSIEKDERRPGWLDRIDAIGATSGWDALAGVFLVMQAWLSTGPVKAP